MNLSFRHYYWRWLKNLIFLFLVFAIFMTLARFSFALLFGDRHTLIQNLTEVKKAFWLGLRFDLMPLAYINILPFILLNLAYFLPGKATIKVTRFFVVTILTLGYYGLMWLYVFDYGFYSYFQEHLNVLFFGFFEDDTKALIISIYKNYNVVLWLSVIFFVHFGVLKLIKLLFSPFDFDLKARALNFRPPLAFFCGLLTMGFLARGNFGRLPLSLEDAYLSENEFINEIALNGALTLNRAIKIRRTFGKDQFNYLASGGFKNWEEAYAAYEGKVVQDKPLSEALLVKTPLHPYAKANPPHVVLVVMESFGSYFNDADTAEFNLLGDLKEHLEKGILFRNFLPAENGTIGSIVSVATSQVIRPGARFLSESEFMSTSLPSSGHLPFRESGYETHFVYGGKLGWRDLGKFLGIQRYDHLWGADEIKEAMPELNHFAANDLGNEWGVFDEYLYAFIDEQLRTALKPQFFLVLTTSNHPPFEYPSSYQPLPVKLGPDFLANLTVDEELAKKRFTGLQYANQKMGEFLTKIRTSSLNDHTIVALTGDHSYWIAKGVGQELEFKRYAVPFYMMVPEKYRPAKIDTRKFGSHEDIFPTLYHLALSDKNYVRLGENLLSEKSFAVNSSGLIANDKGAYHHGKYWSWKDLDRQILQATDETPELLELRRRSLGQIGLTDSYLKSEKNRKPTDAKSDQR